jgi:hypothetical protein
MIGYAVFSREHFHFSSMRPLSFSFSVQGHSVPEVQPKTLRRPEVARQRRAVSAVIEVSMHDLIYTTAGTLMSLASLY